MRLSQASFILRKVVVEDAFLNIFHIRKLENKYNLINRFQFYFTESMKKSYNNFKKIKLH